MNITNPRRAFRVAATAALLAGASTPALAENYFVNFSTLNDSGVTGTAMLDYDPSTTLLTVTFDVSGLDPSGGHVAHIHGRFGDDGTPINSVSPTISNDSDGDGYIELAEAASSYGDVLLPLGDIGSSASGTSNFSMTYDLSDQSIFNNGYDMDDLTPFSLREIVIHGLTVAPGPGTGTDGEVDGTNGYLGVLPVASGQIAVPEPSTWAMLILGFGLIGGTMRLNGKRRVSFRRHAQA